MFIIIIIVTSLLIFRCNVWYQLQGLKIGSTTVIMCIAVSSLCSTENCYHTKTFLQICLPGHTDSLVSLLLYVKVKFSSTRAIWCCVRLPASYCGKKGSVGDIFMGYIMKPFTSIIISHLVDEEPSATSYSILIKIDPPLCNSNDRSQN